MNAGPARSLEIRKTRARERAEIRENGTWREALLDPSPALGTYRLHMLFAPKDFHGIIPLVGEHKLARALRRMGAYPPSPEARLDSLTTRQRHQLVQALESR